MKPSSPYSSILQQISLYRDYNFIFPMAYCNGALHIGHCYVLMQIDVRARYLKSLNNSVTFIFPWHLTGIHIPLTFDKLLKKDKVTINSLITAFSLEPTEINQILLKINTLPEYLEFIQTYNKIAVEDLKIEINWQSTHGTSILQPAYDSFVTWIFNKLQNKNLLKEAMHYIIWCENCKHAIGDHDRAEGEKAYIVKYNFLKKLINSDTKRFLILLNTDNSSITLISKDSKVYFNRELCEEWILTQFMLDLFVNYTFEFIENYENNEENTYLLNSNSLNIKKIGSNADFSQYFFVEKVVCRCGTNAIIKKTLENFICYSDVIWKAKTKSYINKLDISEFARNLLYNQLTALNDWPFSRNIGLGSYYKNRLIDPLSDSTMFMFYSLIHKHLTKQEYSINFWDNVMCKIKKLPELDYALEFWDTVVNATGEYDLELKVRGQINTALKSYCVETTGKDLLSNHILFTLFFQALFELDLTKEVNALGFILHDNTKMSKSKLNTIYISDFKNENIDLVRYYLTTISEELKDGDFSDKILANLKNEYETSIKLYNLWQITAFVEIREENTLFDIEFLKEVIATIIQFKKAIQLAKLKTAYGLIARDLHSTTKNYLEFAKYSPSTTIIQILHKFLNASLGLVLVSEIETKFSLSEVYNLALQTIEFYNLDPVYNNIFSSSIRVLDKLKKDINQFLGNKKIEKLNISIKTKGFYDILKSNSQTEKYFSNKYNIITKILYNPNITRQILLND